MGDSTDGITGIEGVGDKISSHWLKNKVKEFEPFALRKYVEKYGMTEGIFKFNQTFRLVYLLTTDADIEREIRPKKVPELVILDNNSVDPEEW